ncbi:rhodanese-like domain-containing protein [Xanthobacter autotrophicus]|uniref:rhodanese-like domain-containing protein n=1 Tax=Xanthobacter autotrophicus TaxID=280 RepID=UPI0024A75EBF|nr:rhodanese-like domain-containing protein [Xanthobacter autotrophicus]MDI4656452.1 hypothetical protein [Xanthobacter autotrophicus]
MTLAVLPPSAGSASVEPASVEPLSLISPGDLRARLAASSELAFVDVREEGVRSRDGHILQSVPLPLSQLELRAGALVPRFATPLVVTDGGDGRLAERAALRLRELGYTSIQVLDGGVAAWVAAGGEVYTGSNVFSKAFGEFVEHAYGTPHLPALEVKARLDRGEDVVVLDGRTLEEFENFHIPGAHAVPNAELPYRVHDLVRSDDTLVVVNCAGRTRSIIGAQALINAGLPNPVVALENGTMAWLFAGYQLGHGARPTPPAPGPDGLEKARASVARLTQRFAIRTLDKEGLAHFQAERGERSLYLLDVRTPEEYAAGHLPGSLWAEGGQLVQATDRWIGTRNARIVLIDDENAVRSSITASWLIQLGIGDVYVYGIDPAAAELESGAERAPVLGSAPAVPRTTPVELQGLLARDAVVVLDLDTSLAYGRGHIPGASFAVRARLPEGLERLPARPLVVTSADGRLAAFAAADLAAVGRHASVLDGGTQAWRAAGLPLEAGETSLLHSADDVWRSPYQEGGDRHAAFRRYLDWEIDLIRQIERDDTVAFKVYP